MRTLDPARMMLSGGLIAAVILLGAWWLRQTPPEPDSFADPRPTTKPVAMAAETRIARQVVPAGATENRVGPIRTYAPGTPTPYWLFSEEDAVRRVKEMTGTSDWIDYVVRRTTANQLVPLLEDTTFDPPDIADDTSPVMWVVAFRPSEPLARRQLAQIGGLDAPDKHGQEADEPGGLSALVVLDEGGLSWGARFIEEFDSGGSQRLLYPDFGALEALPEVAGSIPTRVDE